MLNNKVYDVVVIGAGPGGLNAGLYTSRGNLETLIVERGLVGGALHNTSDVENYIGLPKMSGVDMASKMEESALSFGAEVYYDEVVGIRIEGNKKVLDTIMGEEIHTYSVILGLGATHRKLGIKGEDEFSGRGVSYCAVCDGIFFSGQDIAVIGGGDSAVEEAIYLTKYANSVTIIHRRGELRAQGIIQQKAFNNPKIKFKWDSIVKEFKGNDEGLTHLLVEDLKTGNSELVQFGGAFVYVGVEPNSGTFKELGILDEQGWVEVDSNLETSIPGIFAVGDIIKDSRRQISIAVGDGAKAGLSVEHYLDSLDR